MIIKDVMQVAVALEARGQPGPIAVAAFAPTEDPEDAWSVSDYQIFRSRSSTLIQIL